jgi:hypothetical protein
MWPAPLLLLFSGAVNTPKAIWDNRDGVFRGVCAKENSIEQQRVKSGVREGSLPGYELGIEVSWQLQNNG